MTPLDLAAIEKAAKEATPGPWYTCGLPWFHTGSGVMAGSPDPHVGFVIADTETWEGEREEYLANDPAVKDLADPDADARFIALANPATILALCERVRELEGALADIPKTWELSYGEVDDYEGSDHRWRVHNRSGNRSDREWDLIGQGDTPADALRDALIYGDRQWLT